MTMDAVFTKENIQEMDPFILLSTLNTKLRNDFDSLAAFCDHYNLDQSTLMTKLGTFGYEYIGEINQFRMP
ncbi:MAG TPA: hypothetical protein DEA52_04420 [Clostridiaceae bacterium]|nr:hypothetical protein [Clostridiaceae bacterium]